jgi:hypothetical protein
MSYSQEIDRAKQLQIYQLAQESDPKTGKKFSARAIAKKLGVGKDAAQKYSERAPIGVEEEVKDVDEIERLAEFRREKFQELNARFNKWIGDTDKPEKTRDRKTGKRIKVAVGNDIHTPYHKEWAVGRFIADNRDADECWIPGDVMDLLSFSHYPKSSQKFSAVEEFQSGRVLIRALSDNFPKVVIMSGNHDDRFIKYLVRLNIPPDILEFFRLMTPDFDSPLAKICAPFPNVEVAKPRELDDAKFPFIHQVGDCILSHAEKFSKIPNRAVGDVIHWLQSYARPQGLVDDFKVVIQAHTHQAGKTYNDYGVVGIEAGTLSAVPGYAGNPKLMGAQRPSVVGYTVVYQENGVTDRNATNFVELGF